MENGNCVATVTQTIQKITTIWKSVTGYIFLMNGIVIVWYSKIQKTVTLSITEDEY